MAVMAGLGTAAGPPVVNVYHEKSRILPDVSRVLACLYEKDVKFETIKASYKDLLSLQASRSVPVPFYDGPVFLQDSRAICRYIAERYEHQGYPFLLGKDVLERASIEQWLRHEEHAFDPPSRALFCHIAFPPQQEDDDDHEGINQETRKLEEVLEVYEQRLGETEFLAGNKFTLADLVHLPGTHHVITSERFAYLYDSRKNVQRWWNEISARDSWQKVLRDMKTVEEQHELEKQRELEEQQKQQWLTAPSQTFGARNIRIDPRKQEGTKSQTVLVAPPSTGTITPSIIPPAPQDPGTTSVQEPSSPNNQRKQSGPVPEKPSPSSREIDSTIRKSPSSDNGTESTFFTPVPTPTTAKTQHKKTDAEKFSYKDAQSPTEEPSPPSRQKDLSAEKTPSSVNDINSTFFGPTSAPISAKERQQIDTEKPSHKDDSSPKKTSHRLPKEAPGKPHLSDFFKASGHKDKGGSLDKPSTQDSSKIPPTSETSDTVFTDKALHKIDEPDSGETKSKPTGVSPQINKSDPLTYTTPDKQTPQTPYVKPPEQSGTDTSTGSEPGQNLKRSVHTAGTPSKEDTPDIISGDDRFSTKRLRAMFNPDVEDSQYPAKQEEALAVPEKHSDIHDRLKQTTMIPDSEKSGSSPSTNVGAPYAPITDEERSAILPSKGGMATTGPENSPSVEQFPPGAPSTDKLAKTAGANTRAPQDAAPKTKTDARSGSALVHGADPSTILTSDEQSGKSSKMGERKPEATPQKKPTAGSRDTSATVQEITLGDRVKQAPSGQGEIQDVQETGDGDTTKKPVVDKREVEPTLNSQQITETIKGVGSTLQGVTGDESNEAAPPAPMQTPASGRQNASIAPHGGTLDTNGKEPVKSSPADPRGTFRITEGRLAQTPDSQHPAASGIVTNTEKKVPNLGKMSAQSPELPLFDTRNKMPGIAETSQTNTEAPNEQAGRRVPRNAEESSSGPSPMKLQEYANEANKEQVSAQQLPSDQSGAKLADNSVREGYDVAKNAKIGKTKEEDDIENADDNNRKAQATSIDGPSKLQIQSAKNKPTTSKDGGTETDKTANSRSLETSREVLPPIPAKSIGQQQLQGNRFGTSVQDNVKQSSEATTLRSGTEQQKKDAVPIKDDKNSGQTPELRYEDKTSIDTKQVKDKISNNKSDSSSKTTQFEGNEDNLPGSQRSDM